MRNAIPDTGPGAEKPLEDRKALAERLKARIDRAVEDAPEELFEAFFRMPLWDDALLERSGSPKPPLFDGKGADDLKLMVALRTFRGTQAALRHASKDVLMSSLISATDLGALARLVSGVQFSEEISRLDPFAGPIARSIEHRRILMSAAGEMLSSSQVEELIGVSRQAIDKRRKSGRLLAMKIGSDWLYPALQFMDGAVEPLMVAVLVAHQQHDPWVTLDTLLAKDDAFGGRSILDLIRERDRASLDRYLSQLEAD